MTAEANAPTLTPDDIPMEFTLEGLRQHFSDEEIAAMNEGDDPILPGVDLDIKTQTDDDALLGDDDDAQGGDAAQAAPANPVPADPGPVQEEQDPPPPVNLSQYEKKIADLDAKIAEINDAYDDGDLTSVEFRAQLAEMVKQQAAAQVALEGAKAIPATPIEDYRKAWFGKVEAYQAQHPYLADDAHFEAWDAMLKMVNANPSYTQLTMGQKIEQAHRLYAAHHQGTTGQPLPTQPGLTKAQKAEAEAKAKAPAPRQDPRPDAPMTLAGLVDANDGSLEDGRFAQIDRIADIDPLRAEAMINALSDLDRAEYFKD